MHVAEAFEQQLAARQLHFAKRAVEPATGFPGAAIANQDVYEGGFQLYTIQHQAEPSAEWDAWAAPE